MASIRVNGVKRQSGAGAHSAKNAQGRSKARGAKKDAAFTEEIGKPFRRGMNVNSKNFEVEDQ